MNEQQTRARSAEKVKQINDLAASLKITISAAQIIKNGMIQTTVIMTDDEDYLIDPPAPTITRGPEEEKNV